MLQEWTDKHYNFSYTLTEKDKSSGVVKLDPYLVSKVWKVGSKDDSGALWHCLKTIARFGEKNSQEREIKALYAQIKRLAEINNVELEDIAKDTSKVSYAVADNTHPSGEGWVVWKGIGTPPVSETIDIKFRDGDIFYNQRVDKWNWEWHDGSGGSEIIAYRVVK